MLVTNVAGAQNDDLVVAGLAEHKQDQVIFAEKVGKNGYIVEEGYASKGSESVDDYSTDGREAYPDSPTEEERATLKRVPDKLNFKAFLICFVELAERFSYYGTTVVLTNAIQQPKPEYSATGSSRPDDVSGWLGQGQRTAMAIVLFNAFWSYLSPTLGAIVADQYLGRMRTIQWSLLVCIIGHILLICTALPNVGMTDRPAGTLALMAIALTIMGLGTGGFKSNISPLVAEQSNNTYLRVKTNKDGSKVLVDPAATSARTYLYFYLLINVGALIGQVSMSFAAKHVGYWLAFTLPTCVLLLCPTVLFFGRKIYTNRPPTKSVIPAAFRVIRLAGRGKWLRPKALKSADFWESAKPANVDGVRPTWMTWDSAFVDEVRRGVKACQIFVLYPLYWVCYNQVSGNLVSQAATLDNMGLPNELVSNLNPLALVVLIPIFDLFIYPMVRKCGIKVTPVRKITAGFITASLSMVSAAVMQAHIYKTSPCGNYAATCEEQPFINLSVWSQAPTFILVAISEIFASITGLEVAYNKAPKSMRSLVTAMFLATSAISSALGQAFLPISEDPLLIYNYAVMAGVSFVAGVLFYALFYKMDREEDKLNELQEGRVGR
ncbi:hypothetical protein OIO90_005018 [Microbotryomycetes sp. JL221]|nr:hypothetical protein OIO90_005018 [Microbotryomycetes sp. JL221]